MLQRPLCSSSVRPSAARQANYRALGAYARRYRAKGSVAGTALHAWMGRSIGRRGDSLSLEYRELPRRACSG